MRIQSMVWLDVNAAWILLAGGILLIYWELCRPGSVLPGSLGGVCVLTAMARFSTEPLRPAACGLFAVGWLVITAEAWWRWPGPPGLAGAVLLTAAAVTAAIRWYLAAPLAMALSFATVILGSAAITAYLAKRI
jgi:membrane-bound ClpP family serine protease